MTLAIFYEGFKNFLWKYGLGLVMCYLPWNEVVLKYALVPLRHYSQGNMKFLPIPKKTSKKYTSAKWYEIDKAWNSVKLKTMSGFL